MFDIYYVEKMNKLKIIPLLLKLKKGKHEGKRRVHKFRINHVELEIEKEVTFNVDGEKLTNNKFIIDIIPQAITVYNDNEFINKIILE
jgi:diacylglycerol kinase family enzyme